MKPLLPTDLPALYARLAVDRPLHWGLARAMLVALESAWRELGRLPAPATPTPAAAPEAPSDVASTEPASEPRAQHPALTDL